MPMRLHSLFLFLFFTMLSLLEAGDSRIRKLSLPITDEIQRADLYFVSFYDKFKAVLILCPGVNAKGDKLIEENKWQKYARDHEVLLIGLSFASKVQDLQNGKGYYYSKRESGKLLLEGLQNLKADDVPLFLYGFSGGAQFVSRFVEWAPEKVTGWCAYSATWWDDPLKGTQSPPGIVACGQLDGIRHTASHDYFLKGRRLGKHWVWVSLKETGHEFCPALDDFIRSYFSLMLEQPKLEGDWYDIEFREKQTSGAHPLMKVWLPDKSLFPLWRRLHSP